MLINLYYSVFIYLESLSATSQILWGFVWGFVVFVLSTVFFAFLVSRLVPSTSDTDSMGIGFGFTAALMFVGVFIIGCFPPSFPQNQYTASEIQYLVNKGHISDCEKQKIAEVDTRKQVIDLILDCKEERSKEEKRKADAKKKQEALEVLNNYFQEKN